MANDELLKRISQRLQHALDTDAFSAEPIDRDEVQRLVEVAIDRAAVPRHATAVQVLLLEGDEKERLIARLSETIVRHWEGGDAVPHGLASDAVLCAPVLAVIVSMVPSWESPGALSRAAAVAQNLILLADAAGLGAHRVVNAHVVAEATLQFAGYHLGNSVRRGELVSLLAIGRPLPSTRPPIGDEEHERARQPARIAWASTAPLKRLPAAEEELKPPSPALRAHAGERVMVVDGDRCSLGLTAAYLRSAGYDVVEVGSAARLRAQIKSARFDLFVVADYLPDAAGVDVVRRVLRAPGITSENTSTAPVMVMTSHRDSSYRIVGLAAGVDYYLRRPLLPVELFVAARLLIDRYRLVEDLQRANREQARLLRELRDAQTRLVQQAKMASLGQLVAGVAHEINTPLGAVVSNNDLLLRRMGRIRAASPATITDHAFEAEVGCLVRVAELSREACSRIRQVVQTLRTFARVDEEEIGPVDLHQSVDTTLSLIAHLTQPSVVVVRRYGELPDLFGRRNQINQLLMNLLVNACQAMGATGTLTLTTVGYGDEIELRIADTGCGIPTANLSKIFDPGFTTKGPQLGTGLGLAISYQIVNEHGGQIFVDSEVGRGTEFTIRLPVRGASPSPSLTPMLPAAKMLMKH